MLAPMPRPQPKKNPEYLGWTHSEGRLLLVVAVLRFRLLGKFGIRALYLERRVVFKIILNEYSRIF